VFDLPRSTAAALQSDADNNNDKVDGVAVVHRVKRDVYDDVRPYDLLTYNDRDRLG